VSGIVPRWEWRTFGDRFGRADEHFAALPPERVQESDELYLLSRGDGDTVKVRGGLMDIKRLEQVNDDGLEQWRPVMKAGFPLGAAEVGSVLAALGLPAGTLERTEYTLDQLLDEVIGRSAQLAAVEVHKRRERYTVGGCPGELTDVGADGQATRTLAIESEDPALVIEAVRELGLETRANTSYSRGLKALLGLA
jgi:exopolyphosphatase/guanosine-5'-triphosphate,3'-diphosphate pyrophosphatase